MPLSEREQRILEEIEKGLAKEDPSLAREIRRESPNMKDRRTVKAGAALFAVGFAILIAFFITGHVLVGVAAFAAMVAGIVMAAGSLKGSVAPRRPPSPSLRDRLESSMKDAEERLKDRYKKR